MATDYEEARPDVAEASEETLQDVQKMDAPTAKSVSAELEENDFPDGLELPGAIVNEELSINVVPPGNDEFVCGECFTIRHRSQDEKTYQARHHLPRLCPCAFTVLQAWS
ncbi:DUF4193 family protein [Glutamicibacter nicotianae]|uniref:DUF4193 family protein n=1 Tax=Glutamicibacter nicotianae TaxID=37929 RepID=UPI0025535D4A|nr:DUF4193 family protein [Glutamicibacter nicotianae]WIV43777.1 DUF4193 family protein [Glutamicibacter nicotianae]